jgi:hypothetical protein
MPKLSKDLSPKESRFSFKFKDYPIGAKVAYLGERVADHKGMSGVIVGYRPSNGLWVKFPNGVGSISVKVAKVLGSPKPKGPKGVETPKELETPSPLETPKELETPTPS